MYQPSYGMYQPMQYQQQMLPYQERMAQPQSYGMPQLNYPTNQPNNFVAKIVDSIDVVRATDIPMDGSGYYFPKADGTEIYVKRWLANGKTEVITYRPIIEEDTSSISTNSLEEQVRSLHEDVVSSFSSIDDRIGKLEKMMLQSTSKKPSKGESE